MKIGERIRAVRLAKSLKGKDLALQAGISPGEVSLLEKQNRMPRADTLGRVAAALEVTTDFLLEEGEIESLSEILARQSFIIFSRQYNLPEHSLQQLEKVSKLPSGPQTVAQWRAFYENLRFLEVELQ